jgi:phosphate acyltransferase
MSGDLGPRVAIAATRDFLDQFPNVFVLLVGDKNQLTVLTTATCKLPDSRFELVHAPDRVTMDDDPLTALRQKKDSSMWIALDLVSKGSADACVSAGNTGALLAMAKHLIKTYPSIDRPAICKAMPAEKGLSLLLDLGANINCTPEQLHQFALMGTVLATQATENTFVEKRVPSVALLNIGKESHKGTDVLQATQELLRQDTRLNYVGFVEANNIFSGTVDVIVCDGFHGNIALKASEGAARFIAKKIVNKFQLNWFLKFLSFLLAPLVKSLADEIDPAAYNGASFLGLQKVVIKSHGSANKKAFLHALMVACEQSKQEIPARIQQLLN